MQQLSLAARCKVKVGLQLYKIQDDLYLLDVRKVDGEARARCSTTTPFGVSPCWRLHARSVCPHTCAALHARYHPASYHPLPITQVLPFMDVCALLLAELKL